ncbi:MAG: hypothetical protein ACTSPD_18895 [Promethearchaeota archaeon]
MSILDEIGYCSNCQQNVHLKREQIDFCIVIILLIFTMGIGLILYFYFYFKKTPNRCELCGRYIPPSMISIQSEQRAESIESTIIGKKIDYCPLCGEKLDDREIIYCPYCSNRI